MDTTRARQDDGQGGSSSSCSGQHEPAGMGSWAVILFGLTWVSLQNTPVWVWFIGDGLDAEELPKTASGKVMKHLLRRWSAKLAGVLNERVN